MNLSTWLLPLLASTSSYVGNIVGPPEPVPIVTGAQLRQSLEIRDTLAAIEHTHGVQCGVVQPGRVQMFLLWTVQWPTVRCVSVVDSRRAIRVTFRFSQGLRGATRLRRTKVGAGKPTTRGG